MPEIKTYADNPTVAAEFADYFRDWINGQSGDKITIALSGGGTPKLLYQILAEKHADAIDWKKLHFFWGDERCVGPDDPESNYGECKALLLDKVSIPAENIHRIVGESDSAEEAGRYENEIYEHVEINDDAVPEFDMILLGMGGDGHTASIFPHQMGLLQSEKVCEPAVHPGTGQHRVTITGGVLNAAKAVVFLITGDSKADVLPQVIDKSGAEFPATHVQPAGSLTFFLDEAAAAKL